MPHAELDYDNPGRITIQTDWVDKELIQQVPGVNWDARRKLWHAPLSWGVVVTLRGVFADRFTYGDTLRDWLWQAKQTWVDPALSMREWHADAGFLPLGEATDPRLFSHQQWGAAFLWTSRDGACLGDDMGTGKTATALSSLRVAGALPAIVICPNSVKHQWAEQAATWLPEAVPYVIGGGATGRRKQLDAALGDPRALVILNYEAVRLHSRLAPYGSVRLQRCIEHGGSDEKITVARCEVHQKELNAFAFRGAIFDEAHRILDPKAKQTRACWAVAHAPEVVCRYALTGTPIASDVSDLWSIMHLLAPLDFPTRGKFIDRYALLAWNRYAALDIVGIRPDTRDELFQILHPRFRRMLKTIVLPHLPAKVRTYREAEMTPAQAKLYRQMESELLAETEDGNLVLATSNLTKAVRLVQFSSASCEVEYGEEQEDGSHETLVRLREPSAKLDVLEEILEELGTRQVAVCAASRQLIELAAARLEKRGTTFRLLTGAIPTTARQANLDDFQNGLAQVMLFTLAAGGVGINLTAADTIVFLQRSWSMLENLQAEDRVHRIGSERHESITIVDVIAPDTIEEHQITRLRAKFERLQEIVRDREALQAAGMLTATLDAEEVELSSGYLL